MTGVAASISSGVAFVCRWIMGGICPSPVDFTRDRTMDEWQSSRKLSLLMLKSYDRIALDQGETLTHDRDILTSPRIVLGTVDNATRKIEVESSSRQLPKWTKGTMPVVETFTRGPRYQQRIREKMKEIQTLTRQQRIFKAKLLPRQYRYVVFLQDKKKPNMYQPQAEDNESVNTCQTIDKVHASLKTFNTPEQVFCVPLATS